MKELKFYIVFIYTLCNNELNSQTDLSLGLRYGIGTNNNNQGKVFQNRLSYVNLGVMIDKEVAEGILLAGELQIMEKGDIIIDEYNSANYWIRRMTSVGINFVPRFYADIEKLRIYGLLGVSLNYNVNARISGMNNGVSFFNPLEVEKLDISGIAGLGVGYTINSSQPFIEARYYHPFTSTWYILSDIPVRYHQIGVHIGYRHFLN